MLHQFCMWGGPASDKNQPLKKKGSYTKYVCLGKKSMTLNNETVIDSCLLPCNLIIPSLFYLESVPTVLQIP